MDATLGLSAFKMYRILVVEDEEIIRRAVNLALQNEGFEVTTVADGKLALDLVDRNGTSSPQLPFDLIILDLILPSVNGLDICQFIRSQGNPTPVLILSAKSAEPDIVLGLEMGADDYLTKPFGIRELIARCRALLRSFTTRLPVSPTLQVRDVMLDPLECRVVVRGVEVKLALKEFQLLEFLMKYPYQDWSREDLLNHVWGAPLQKGSKTVDVHIGWLREKIERDTNQPEYITTVRGLGYRFG